jgi:hypothetical protein
MNIQNAMKKVAEGKLVRRKGWKTRLSGKNQWQTIHIGRDEEGLYQRIGLPSEGGTVTFDVRFNMDDLTSSDWMVVR